MSEKTHSRQTQQPMTNQKAQTPADEAFWRHHPDPTQAAVHLALQWLAFVYPASELQIDKTLKAALPYADADLSARWSRFLNEKDVNDHVQALEWVAQTLSDEQVPFLIETGWRLLLVDHELPSQVPLALRILARILGVEEQTIQSIGESVFREYVNDDEDRQRAPLLPVDPRYLDRVEWRLYGHTATTRMKVPEQPPKPRNYRGLGVFFAGSLFGALVVIALVFGPLQLGRMSVPIMLHDGLLVEGSEQAPELIVTNPDRLPLQGPVNDVAEASQAQSEAPAIEPVEPADDVQDAVTEAAAAPTDTLPRSTEPADETASETEPSADSSQADDAPAATVSRTLMAVTASILNVRSDADVNSEVLIKLAEGDRVWAFPSASEGQWMQIQVDGITGYASTRFLEPVDE